MNDHLLKTFKSQEIAREKNKLEQRKLNIDLQSKNGPEAVYRLNLDKLNKEQRMVARDLGRITRGTPKRTASPLTLSIERGREQRIIEQQLQRIRQGVHRRPGMSTSLLTPEKKFHHPQFNFQSGISDDIGIKEPTYSKSFSERDLKDDECSDIEDNNLDGFMIIQLLASGTQNTDKARQHAQTAVELRKFKNPSVNQSIKQDVIDPVPVNRLTEIGNIESVQANQEHLDQELNNVINETSTQSPLIPTCKQPVAGLLLSHSTEDDIPPVKSHVQHLDLASLSKLDMSNIRGNINRRLSKGGVSSERNARKTGSEVVPETKRRISTSDTRLPTTDSAVKASGYTGNSTVESNVVEMEVQVRKPTRSVDDILKKSVYDPEYYNPDGSVKTMHNMPKFEEAWQQAEKARYIRTKDPREFDKELSTREIFSKH